MALCMSRMALCRQAASTQPHRAWSGALLCAWPCRAWSAPSRAVVAPSGVVQLSHRRYKNYTQTADNEKRRGRVSSIPSTFSNYERSVLRKSVVACCSDPSLRSSEQGTQPKSFSLILRAVLITCWRKEKCLCLFD